MQRPSYDHVIDPDGILLRRDALERGVDDKALARLVDGKVLVKLRHAIYCRRSTFLAADPAERHRLLSRGVIKLYGGHVALSHASACIAQGGPDYGLDLSSVHLTHLSGGGRRKSRVRHHNGTCLVGDLRRQDGHWITTPARSVADTVCTDGVVAGLVQANHFLHAGLTTIAELIAVMDRSATWPGSLQHHPVLHLADARIESVGETRCDHVFFTQGLPRPEPQYKVHDDARGVTYRVDFAWPEQRVIVEFDGAEKYHRYRRDGETVVQMVVREKLREDRIREITGWLVIRLTWHDLDFPNAVARRIRDKFALRGAVTLRRVASA